MYIKCHGFSPIKRGLSTLCGFSFYLCFFYRWLFDIRGFLEKVKVTRVIICHPVELAQLPYPAYMGPSPSLTFWRFEPGTLRLLPGALPPSYVLMPKSLARRVVSIETRATSHHGWQAPLYSIGVLLNLLGWHGHYDRITTLQDAPHSESPPVTLFQSGYLYQGFQVSESDKSQWLASCGANTGTLLKQGLAYRWHLGDLNLGPLGWYQQLYLWAMPLKSFGETDRFEDLFFVDPSMTSH